MRMMRIGSVLSSIMSVRLLLLWFIMRYVVMEIIVWLDMRSVLRVKCLLLVVICLIFVCIVRIIIFWYLMIRLICGVWICMFKL